MKAVRASDHLIERFDLRHDRGATQHFAGEGALAVGLTELVGRLRVGSVFVISAPRVWGLHGGELSQGLAAIGIVPAAVLEVPDGEAAKTVAVAERLWRELARGVAKRDSSVLAFGGGSVGDVAGFAAATFARGLAWAQVPTTLLAQVDAAIGGKTAVDLPEAKNAVGAFHHATAVIADPRWLATLPPAELRSGLVEAIKAAALLDPALLARIERSLEALLAGAPEALGPVVAAAARAKVALVERDPEERDQRRLLNFGHTLGHALEAEAGYGRLAHGDAVAHGMDFALRLSVARGGDPAFAARLRGLLRRLGVPPLPPLAAPALWARMARDKKARESGLVWVLALEAGRGHVDAGMPPELVRAELEAWLGRPASESL